jgi:hypothetical protein
VGYFVSQILGGSSYGMGAQPCLRRQAEGYATAELTGGSSGGCAKLIDHGLEYFAPLLIIRYD